MNIKELLKDKAFRKGGIPKGFSGIDEMVSNCQKEKRTTCKDCKDECLI